MTDIEYMYVATCKSLIASIKEQINGYVHTDYKIDAKVCVVDIRFKDIEYRHIVSNFDKFVYEGGIDQLAIVIVGAYKKYVNSIIMRKKEPCTLCV